MADVQPNFKAEHLKMKIHLSSLETNLIRSELEIVEAENKIKLANINIESTKEAVTKQKAKLATFDKDHAEQLKEQQKDG